MFGVGKQFLRYIRAFPVGTTCIKYFQLPGNQIEDIFNHVWFDRNDFARSNQFQRKLVNFPVSSADKYEVALLESDPHKICLLVLLLDLLNPPLSHILMSFLELGVNGVLHTWYVYPLYRLCFFKMKNWWRLPSKTGTVKGRGRLGFCPVKTSSGRRKSSSTFFPSRLSSVVFRILCTRLATEGQSRLPRRNSDRTSEVTLNSATVSALPVFVGLSHTYDDQSSLLMRR